MLHSIKTFDGFAIKATDGELGHIKDIYFDDEKWTIRYLEVDTGGWITGRRVLISPFSVSGINWADETVSVNLTKQQVNDSPGINSAKPVSRQHETDLANYYGYPYYWSGPYSWGYTVLPALFEQKPFEDPVRQARREQMEESNEDPHLRSKDEVIGYDISALDDSVGHVDDFLFDEKDWSISLLIIDTRHWLPGKHVMISPQHIERVDWDNKTVAVDVTREQIESSPEYDADHPPERGAVVRLYRHTGRDQPLHGSSVPPEARGGKVW